MIKWWSDQADGEYTLTFMSTLMKGMLVEDRARIQIICDSEYHDNTVADIQVLPNICPQMKTPIMSTENIWVNFNFFFNVMFCTSLK